MGAGAAEARGAATAVGSEGSREAGWRSKAEAEAQVTSLLRSPEALPVLGLQKAFGKMLYWPWLRASWEEVIVIQAMDGQGLSNSNGVSVERETLPRMCLKGVVSSAGLTT